METILEGTVATSLKMSQTAQMVRAVMHMMPKTQETFNYTKIVRYQEDLVAIWSAVHSMEDSLVRTSFFGDDLIDFEDFVCEWMSNDYDPFHFLLFSILLIDMYKRLDDDEIPSDFVAEIARYAAIIQTSQVRDEKEAKQVLELCTHTTIEAILDHSLDAEYLFELGNFPVSRVGRIRIFSALALRLMVSISSPFSHFKLFEMLRFTAQRSDIWGDYSVNGLLLFKFSEYTAKNVRPHFCVKLSFSSLSGT